MCLTFYPALMGLQRQGEIFIKTPLELTEDQIVLTLESYLFIAISWSAVPEQPLDVTANGFPQGTTKKGILSLQARYSAPGQTEGVAVCSRLTATSRTFSSPQKKTLHPLAVTVHPSLSPPLATLIYILSPWIYLFRTYHINGIYIIWPFMSNFIT